MFARILVGGNDLNDHHSDFKKGEFKGMMGHGKLGIIVFWVIE